MNNNRSRQINTPRGDASSGPIVYWMSRDQRVRDNWALLYAQREAIRRKVPLLVLFCFVPHFLEGTIRQYGFMLRGLPQVEANLRKRNIPFFFLSGEPKDVIPAFLNRMKASGLFVDFSPLRTKKRWLRDVEKNISIPIFEVDAHNIIPCWRLFSSQVSDAEAFRVKLRSTLPTFLNAFPAVRKHPVTFARKTPSIPWDSILDALPVDRTVTEVSWVLSGESEAQRTFRRLLKEKIHEYKSGTTGKSMRGEWQWRLQPYFHFGQLSIQKVVWSVMHSEIDSRFKAAFLESLITKRELADHFCYYNAQYDSVHCFPEWAKKTLHEHHGDVREYVYARRKLEAAQTHDELWNSLQRELMSTGRIFGWARAYWSKKLLEWTRSPQEALRLAILFTEKYSLNGWDPNGYLNIARAIGGVYDSPSEAARPVVGNIKYLPPKNKDAHLDLKTYIGKR